MNTQPDMFAREPRAVARRGDLETSHLAAEDITPRIRILQAAVLSFAASCRPFGFTDPAMNNHFETHSSTYRTRRAELVGMGMIEDSGERICIGVSGRKHAVWRITDRGWAKHLELAVGDLAAAA